ncbi:MAG: serine hydrolase [Ignavibacteriales bacterium]|nr:serine hydrolase [Ignavibacteriales bacterium]
MKYSKQFIVVILGILLSTVELSSQSPQTDSAINYWPTSTPEKQGFNSLELAKLFDNVKDNNIDLNSIIIIRNGHLILEAYLYPFQKNVIHDIASVTKSITSLATGIAIDKGYIKSVNEPVLGFFSDRSVAHLNENKKALTIEHLLTMTSALCRNFQEGEEQTVLMRQSGDCVQYFLDLPLVDTPGKKFVYSSLAPHILSTIITRTTGMNLLEFTQKNLFQPLGIKDVRWEAEQNGNTNGWGDLFIAPVDLAKIGYLVLNDGIWEGNRVISKEWIKRSSQPHVYEDSGTAYGYLWWLPLERLGLFEGRGRGGQRLIIWPQKNIIVILIGNGGYTLGDIGEYIARAFASDTSLPENPKAVKLLEQKINEASKAPASKPVTTLPALAKTLSGKEYFLETNSLGLLSFTMVNGTGKEDTIKMSYEGVHTVLPVGLDDVYRISNTSKYNLPAGAKGSWTSENTFCFTYNEPSNDRLLQFQIEFKSNLVELKVSERTGLFGEITIKGRMRQSQGKN